MERWGVAVNNVYKTGHVYREEGPWYLFFIEWLADFVCDLFFKLPTIPMPKWHTCNYCFFGPKDLEENEVSTLAEEYGDLTGLICYRFHNPIMQWCHRKYKHTRMNADIDDLAVFHGWVAEMRDSVDDDGDEDEYRNPKHDQIEEARQQIFALWETRKRLTDEIISEIRSG